MENEVIEKEETNISESNTQPVLETAEQKPKPNKKKIVKILVPILVVIILIALALGIVSLVNYNANKPYNVLFNQLECTDFVYYEEYEELSSFNFYEYDEGRNFIQKALNIYKYHEIELVPKIYYLYDEDYVEDNEKLKDLIAEEEDEEVYYDIPRICELSIDGGNANINFDGDVIFTVNYDNDGAKVAGVTYDDGYTQKEYINDHNDSKLKEKYETSISDYESYLEREMNADSYLYAAENASLYYNNYDIGSTISDFASERISNPEITINAHRYDEKIYIVTVSGDWMYNSATVVFRYNSEENVSRVAKDSSQAFTWYIYEKFPSYAYFPM